MLDAIWWFVSNLGLAFYDLGYALTHPASWLSWVWNGLASPEDKQALMRFIYYGGSQEFFFIVFDAFLILTVLGLWKKSIMWRALGIFEGTSNRIGRLAAWAGLLMVMQQIIIVFLQRIFRVAEIDVGVGAPFGYQFFDFLTYGQDLSWWAEELKFYNAIIVTMCAAYTMVQGGHVRVDLFYAGAKFRTKKIVDMFGSAFFMMPAMTLVWMYAWFFMWRHLITPKVSASDKIELLLRKARIVKWNVETIGFSPNGFNGYFLFKILLVGFTAIMFMQAVAFLYRAILEYREGEESAGKNLDKDTLGEGEEAFEGTH